MSTNRAPRYCGCGTRLARDNRSRRCAACQARARDLMLRPPDVPAQFWDLPQLRDALAGWHIGHVISAYRHHPYHGQVLRQELVAGWVGLTQAQLSRIENGPPVKDLDKLTLWAHVLGIPPHLLWFQLRPWCSAGGTSYPPGTRADDHDPGTGPRQPAVSEVDDMNRRELLRLMSMTSSAVAAYRLDGLDWERVDHAVRRPALVDHPTLDQLAALNTRLWESFHTATRKVSLLPLAQRQLHVLTTQLHASPADATHRRLCALVGDLSQLTGEILFDINRYTEAAHCYTLAVTASREAGAHDLWACALTRHAFISVYEREFRQAASMLEFAATIAQQGDSRLSTRHWVDTVRAKAYAGLGDLAACERALARAEQVTSLEGRVHNGGWLRFDGSRLAEERGASYVALACPDRAEPVLLAALDQDLSNRRRGGVLCDLAIVGVQRGDPHQVLSYANAAIDTVRQTRSGVVGRHLQHLHHHLAPLLADHHIRHLRDQITELTSDHHRVEGDHIAR